MDQVASLFSAPATRAIHRIDFQTVGLCARFRCLLPINFKKCWCVWVRAVRSADNKAPGLDLEIDDELARRNSLSTVIDGYGRNLIEPTVMLNFAPMGPVRVVLEVITPSEGCFCP